MLICGAGGHAKVVIDCLNDLNIEVQAIFDPATPLKDLKGIPVLKEYDPDRNPASDIVIAIGDNEVRRRLSGELKHPFGRVLHPSASIAKSVQIDEGTVVFHHAVVQVDSRIGAHCIVNTSASIDHDCLIEDFVHISPNATLCGNVSIGEGTHIGAGAVIIPGIKIGRGCIIGAGSVIIEDVPDFSMVVGNPGKIKRSLK